MKTAWRIIVGKPDLRLELAAAEARAERYREAAQAYVDSVLSPAPIDTPRSLAWGNLLAALADTEEQTRGEHLAEQRASEDWQEEKHARRGEE